MAKPPEMILEVAFFATELGTEPVRDWLRALSREARKIIGEDIKTVQFGWPLGMPLVRKLGKDLWEVRSKMDAGIVRVLFTVVGETMVLLHAFAKKSQKMPIHELNLARRRLQQVQREERS